MARVNFVKKARKAYPNHGIAKGESYYWWKFRYGGKYMSKTRPRASQLTGSDFLSNMYAANENVSDAIAELQAGKSTPEDLACALEGSAENVREAGDECTEKHGNMPEGLQQGDTGQLLETRAEQCETIASELEEAANSIRNLEFPEPKDGEPPVDYSEAINAAENISWDFE